MRVRGEERLTQDQLDALEVKTGQGIAPHLGPNWSVDQTEQKITALQGPNRFRLILVLKYDTIHGYRLKIYGVTNHIGNRFNEVPKDLENVTTSINVSPDKEPEAIAKEIKRRLLPGYEKVVKGIIEQIAKCEADEKAKFALHTQISTILGEKGPDLTREFFDVYGPSNRTGGPFLEEIQVSATTVTMRVRSMPSDLALDLCQRIADYWAGKGVSKS